MGKPTQPKTARNARIMELFHSGESLNQIAAALATEGWERISPNRVHQIIQAMKKKETS